MTETPQSTAVQLAKVPTGIEGFDEITFGGLPAGRTTLLTGLSGSGKTVFGMQFLAQGAARYGEPGVLVGFEETEDELITNAASLGFDFANLISAGKLVIDRISVEPDVVVETGRYDLSALHIRIEHAVDSIGARRIVLDGIPALFYGLTDTSAVRIALTRLYAWLKSKGLTALVTAESNTELAQHGLGLSLTDCIVVAGERTRENVSTRYLRVAKYRGSAHGTSEYPCLIGSTGYKVIPLTSITVDYEASTERISTGIPRLDTMLGGQGFYRGNSVMVTGGAGTGKSSLAAHLALATCQRGKRCLYFAFEESQEEVMRNMRSIGVDLRPQVAAGLLKFRSSRATMFGLEMHLAMMENEIAAFQPHVVILDPVSNLLSIGSFNEVRAMVSRLVDFLKGRGITSLLTSLSMTDPPESDVGVSSLVDTWMLLTNFEANGEQTRLLRILKSRGSAHSSQVREFIMTDRGVRLEDVYLGPEGMLTGTARKAQEARELAEADLRLREMERKERQYQQRRAALQAQVAALQAEIEATEVDMEHLRIETEQYEAERTSQREERAHRRWADGDEGEPERRRGRTKK